MGPQWRNEGPSNQYCLGHAPGSDSVLYLFGASTQESLRITHNVNKILVNLEVSLLKKLRWYVY